MKRGRGAKNTVAVGLPRLPSGDERSGLARPGGALDHVNSGARAGEVPHHGPLLGAQLRPTRQAGAHGLASDDGDRSGAASQGPDDESLFGGEHLGRGPADLIDVGGHDGAVLALDHVGGPKALDRSRAHDMLGAEERVAQCDDRVDRGAVGEAVADGADDITPSEGRRLPGQPLLAWSKATFSQAERSIDPGKSRAFSADEIVAFADTFGLPVVWFFLPPPPGTDGTPTRAEAGQTPTEYASELRRLLQRVVGTPEHRADIDETLAAFAKEITARALAEAVDVVAAGTARLRVDEPNLADELRRWREALQAIAEGLGAIEEAVAERAEPTKEPEVDWPDLRTMELPLRGDTVRPRTSREASIELEP